MAWALNHIFDAFSRRRLSDMVFVPGAPPVVWEAGQMKRVAAPPIAPGEVEGIFADVLSDEQRGRLERNGDLDFSVGRNGVGRFRVNLHQQRGTLAAALRFIPAEVPPLESLKLPAQVLKLADLTRGLVLVTGCAGAGKSTTLAAMLEYMNHRYAYHIITLEDPVEFCFQHRKSIVEQREIGDDCVDFARALRAVVRQKPDVIMVGEMRDLETISAALTAAETGHLVLASLHTVTAVETINRILDVFPAVQQGQIRMQLADTLQGVVCQALLHDELDGTEAPAVELMLATPAIRRAIRDSETHLIEGMIETGRGKGMQTMDAAIAELVLSGRVAAGEGLMRARKPERLARTISGQGAN